MAAASPFRGKVEKKGGEFGVRSAAKTSCSGVFGPTSALPSPVRSQALPRAKGDPHLLVSELGKNDELWAGLLPGTIRPDVSNVAIQSTHFSSVCGCPLSVE